MRRDYKVVLVVVVAAAVVAAAVVVAAAAVVAAGAPTNTSSRFPLHCTTLPPAAGPNMASITTPPIQILRPQELFELKDQQC